MRVTLEPDKMVWERREKSQQRERSSFYLAAPHDGIWQLVTSRAPCLGGKKSCDLYYKNLCVWAGTISEIFDKNLYNSLTHIWENGLQVMHSGMGRKGENLSYFIGKHMNQMNGGDNLWYNAI